MRGKIFCLVVALALFSAMSIVPHVLVEASSDLSDTNYSRSSIQGVVHITAVGDNHGLEGDEYGKGAASSAMEAYICAIGEDRPSTSSVHTVGHTDIAAYANGVPHFLVQPAGFNVTLPPDVIWESNLYVKNSGAASLSYSMLDVQTTGTSHFQSYAFGAENLLPKSVRVPGSNSDSRPTNTVDEPSEGSSAAVEGQYSDIETDITSVINGYGIDPSGEVALFQNSNPWNRTSIQDILTANNISYDIYNTSQMGSVNLRPYKKVIIASVQGDIFYEALEANSAWFESYASIGGVLEMHLCAQSSHMSGGRVYPAGFVFFYDTSNYVSIVDPGHPVLNTPNAITDEELDNWGSSIHGWFSSIPSAGDVVLTATYDGNPVWVETDFVAGEIFATTQTVEWRNESPEFLENMILYIPTTPLPDCSWLDEDEKSGSLEPWSSDSVKVSINTTGLSLGEYYSEIYICNSDINGNPVILPVQLTVGEAKPDLAVDKWEEWVDYLAGTYNVTYKVTNQGFAPAGASNTTININGTVIEDNVPGLAVGMSYNNTFGPFTLSDGADNIQVCIDSNDSVDEACEDNNCLDNEWPQAWIMGVIGEANCQTLENAGAELLWNDAFVTNTTSGVNGIYRLPLNGLGDYTVVVKADEFKDETQTITIAEAEQMQQQVLDFIGETGLVPRAATMAYVLECVNHWLYPPGDKCDLTMAKVLAVVNAWLYPT